MNPTLQRPGIMPHDCRSHRAHRSKDVVVIAGAGVVVKRGGIALHGATETGQRAVVKTLVALTLDLEVDVAGFVKVVQAVLAVGTITAEGRVAAEVVELQSLVGNRTVDAD